MRSDEFDLFINDQFVARISKKSSLVPSGQVGFYLATPNGAMAQPSIVQFDNVSVNPQ